MWDGFKIDPGTAEIMRQNQIFVLNRGMNTRLVLPNNQSVYPLDNIPPMEIVTVELAYSARYKTIVDKTDSILKNIAIQLPEAAQSDHIDEVSGGDKPAGKGQRASLSLGLVRALQYMAQDYHAWRMFHMEDQVTRLTSEEFEDLANQKELAVAGTKLKTLHTNVRQADKAHLTEEGAPARLGAELVDRIVHTVGDGGLGWVYATLNTDPNHMPPSERPAMAYFAMADSHLHRAEVLVSRGSRPLGRTAEPSTIAALALKHRKDPLL
jgi:hypothetical protein